jgi:hypothetical protein
MIKIPFKVEAVSDELLLPDEVWAVLSELDEQERHEALIELAQPQITFLDFGEPVAA